MHHNRLLHVHVPCEQSTCTYICIYAAGRLTELDLSVHAQEDVVALDVTVDHLV